MKKILVTALAVFFILSSFGTMANADLEKTGLQINTDKTSIYFEPLMIKQENIEYLSIEMQDVSTYLNSPGKPILPKVIKTFEVPVGSKNIEVDVTISEITEEIVTREIKPASYMLPLTSTELEIPAVQEKDLEVYSSNNPYPSEWYSYDLKSGLNEDNERVIFVTVSLYPVRYTPNAGKLLQMKSSEIKVTYESSGFIENSVDNPYDLVIIAPSKFEPYLEKLVKHKNDNGVKTFLKTTEEIYADDKYDGVDKPEDIKLFIKDALDTHEISYVLLVGGLKNQIFAKPKDDANQGSTGWYLPVRYTNLYDKPKFPLESEENIFDPGVISDLYYADIYDAEDNFSSWNPNNDDYFAAWGKEGVEDDEDIDMVPDVSVGRLACRNIKEVKTVVEKIINYETKDYTDSDWYNTMTVISGDGFLDQEDLNFQWDTTGLPNGYYTIYAQSFNDEDEAGPTDAIQITINRSEKTDITFNHDDHLNPALEDGYPTLPIAEICSISEGNTLGYNDFTETPGEGVAYCNNFNPWANMSYVDCVLTIRGKSYDPKPYGNITNIHVWIKNKDGIEVYSDWRNNTEMYYEGEWTTGEKVLKGRGGALYYMDDFEKNVVWASNGRFTGVDDVISEWNKGSRFVFISGHGSPNVWADHYPGVPGNRGPASITGMQVTQLSLFNLGGLLIGQRTLKNLIPLFPIDSLSNGEKLPVAVIGGCHNSQFNVSMIPGFLEGFQYIFPNLHIFDDLYMWCHGSAVPECFSWRLVRNPNGGTIASIGNTGLGYGMPGKDLTTGGGDGWITIEFFRQVGEEDQTILGDAHTQSIKTYIQTHDMSDFESGHPKSVQQWVLFGDPTLKIGGEE